MQSSARLFNCARCRRQVVICSHCDRGNIYCSKRCSQTARREEEYGIDLSGFAFALIGALIVAKVVLVLDPVLLGRWVGRHPAFVDVLLRTFLYGLGVTLVLVLEQAFDGRHDYGGFAASLTHVAQHVDIYHVWIDSIVISLSLLVFNVFAVIRRHLGTGGLARLLLSPRPTSDDFRDDG